MIAEFTTAQFVRLTPAQKNQLRALAERHGCTPSALVRQMIDDRWTLEHVARKRGGK